EGRRSELTAAESIVEDEVKQFLAWTRGLEVQPTVVAMRARTRAVLVAEMEKTLATRLKHLPEGDRAAMQQMVDSAVNKLLHVPTTKLKARAADGDDAGEMAATLRFLFDLQEIGVGAGAGAGAEKEKAAEGEGPAEVTAREGGERLPH
ncbi:MAG TPA: glutamyl-tRNA reductase, partial [Polyangiaceae bacterium]